MGAKACPRGTKKIGNKCIPIKKIVKGKVEYDNRSNDYFHEWWYLEGYSSSNKWLKEFEGTKVKITVELMK